MKIIFFIHWFQKIMKQIKQLTKNQGIDWWIKWFASIVLIIGVSTTAMNMYPYNILKIKVIKLH